MEEEMILENIWSRFLGSRHRDSIPKKKGRNLALEPTEPSHQEAADDRLEHRRNIEHFKTMGIQMLKSAYRACVPDEEIASLAATDFHSSQTVYQEELQYLESWVKEFKLEELEFARIMPLICLYPPAATLFPCELYEARMAMSKHNILLTVVDDLFDVGGSREEMENLVKLIEMWDAHDQVGFCSERVEIVFGAIYDTNNQLAAKATAIQNRNIIDHLADL